MDWLGVYEDFTDLPKQEQHRLFEAIKETLFPAPKIHSLLNEIREAKFSAGLACLHCGSHSVKRNGKYRGRQRYLCHDCHKSFNDTTGTPMAGTHKPNLWLQYFEMMIEGLTLPKIAERLNIHVSTAFYWRHKILNALRSLGNGQLSGIIESDETHFLESEKGRKGGIPHRDARKRGRKVEDENKEKRKRGISKEQVSVVVAYDRNGNIICQMGGRGRIKAEDIDKVIGGHIEASSLLCTDSATNFKKFAKMKGLPHEILPRGTHVSKSIYHIQHVNSFHSRLKRWMDRFQGVATKYIDNYMFWFRFLELHKKLEHSDRQKKMLLDTCRQANFMTVQQFKASVN